MLQSVTGLDARIGQGELARILFSRAVVEAEATVCCS